ncbi:MAG: hypothetical protein ACRCWF_12240 [Beijerinckiaceae bacterium]
MIKRDIAIPIYSRGREDYLSRLIEDMMTAYLPALEAGDMTACAFVYAQGYPADYVAALTVRFAEDIRKGKLLIVESKRPHTCIGEVAATAFSALNDRVDYRLAMLMDDDSRYRSDAVVDNNLRLAARSFLDQGDRAYSIKLGNGRDLNYWPFIEHAGPIMPFKEKMIWLNRKVLEEAIALPGFATLSVGEDVVLSALAWRGDAERCFGVFGIATFLHLGFEPDIDTDHASIGGGYGELMGHVEGISPPSELGKYEAAYRSGVTPHDVMPDIFVGKDHPHYVISGVKPEAVARYAAHLSPIDTRTRKAG